MFMLRGLPAILLPCLAAPSAIAGELPPAVMASGENASLPDAASGQNTRVFVQLVVNQMPSEGFVALDASGEHLLIAADDLAKAGIAIAQNGTVDLATRTDMRPRYDPLEQRLSLDVDPALLPQTRLKGTAAEQVRATADTGAAFNYDLYVQRSGGTTTARLYSEQRLFSRHGIVSTSGTLRVGLQGGGDGYLRYDTRYRHVDQDHALAVTVGDLVTASLPWSTSLRMGGLQIGRNFAARPDLVTTPLPSFAGQAAVPSSVDLFIDGYRQQRTSVAPGRFVLDDMPVVTGAGQATVVTTDAVGRQVATTIPFYVSTSLLRPGLTDFSFEVGALRRGYGLRSFDYGSGAASFVVRHGMNQKLTLSAHGEASGELALGGIGIDWSPGLWGAAHLNVSASQSHGRTGTQLTLGYDYSGRRFAIAAEHRRASGDFRNLGSFDLGRVGKQSSSRVVASTQLARLGSVGMSYIDARSRGLRTRLLSASWSLPIAGSISMFASADYDVRRSTASGQLRIVVPLGRASAGSGLSRSGGQGLRTDATFDLAVPTGGGFGLSAGAAVDDRGSAYGQTTARLRERYAEFEAGASLAGRATSMWAGASGSVIVMAGGVFAATDAPTSFAVVETGASAGVPVTYENQPIGTTDSRGRLFIRDVTAYYRGRIGIDPLSLDAGLVTSTIETRVAIQAGAGAIVHMPIRRVRSVTASLIDAAGKHLPAGSMAILPDGNQAPIGWDGILYLADLPRPTTIAVRREDGSLCRASLVPPALTRGLTNLGAVSCT